MGMREEEESGEEEEAGETKSKHVGEKR